MSKTAAVAREKIYECEVKRKRLLPTGGYGPFWKTKSVIDAIADDDTEFRCKDCHGQVKLFRKHVAHAAAPHIEHKERSDSEYCPAGMYFREATDGREPRLSENPVL